MTKFTRQLLIFLIFPILYFGFNISFNMYCYANSEIALNNTSILIMGDSHPQMSLNPKLFYSAQNISQPAEPYVLTFWKLKKIIRSNKPDTLILGFAPHNISAYNDLKFSNRDWSSEIFKRSYPIENLESIDHNIDVDYFDYYRTVWKEIGFYPKNDHFHFIGHYENSGYSNLTKWEASIKRHYFTNDSELGVSDVAISHMDSIVNLCNNKGITLILESNPIHKNYLDNIPTAIMNKYSLLKRKYENRVIIIDETRKHYADTLYLNSDHLNKYGANKFSNEVISYLKQNKVRMRNNVYN